MSESTSSTTTANIDLAIGQRRLQARIEVPTGPTPLIQLLPIVRSLTRAAVEAAAENAAEHGMPISCRAGCAACCRHLVPLTEIEARRTREVVEAMPEPRRTEVKDRFEQAKERLREAGLLDRLAAPDNRSIVARGDEYLVLKIPCPFLENESCSIYEERPLVCREYIVVSPPEHCGDPRSNQVRVVKLPFEARDALAQVERPVGEPVRVPLILALEWAQNHPEPPPDRTGPELLGELFRYLTGKSIPAPSAPEPT